MNTQKIVKDLRICGWGEVVKERIASGQSVKAFCKEKGVSITTYYYRQKKVREAACDGLKKTQNREDGLVPSGWAQFAEAEPVIAAESALTIDVGGCHITANAETDPELLAKVCRILRSL